jgi:hypothetical protein
MVSFLLALLAIAESYTMVEKTEALTEALIEGQLRQSKAARRIIEKILPVAGSRAKGNPKESTVEKPA